jgi:hypothetical protein
MNDHGGRENPTIPQNASPEAQERRLSAVASARRTWT